MYSWRGKWSSACAHVCECVCVCECLFEFIDDDGEKPQSMNLEISKDQIT